MITLPKTLISLVLALAAGLALAQNTPADADPRDPEEPEPVAEALLDPIPIAAGTDDFEFAFELVRFDLGGAGTAEGPASFEITLESKPDYISDFRTDKKVLAFDPEEFTGKVVASFDVAERASSDGTDEIVLLLTAKDEATKPGEGRVTIPIELLNASELFLLARIHTENLNLETFIHTWSALSPERMRTLESVIEPYADDNELNPPYFVPVIALVDVFRAPRKLEFSNDGAKRWNDRLLAILPETSIEDWIQELIDSGRPLGLTQQRLLGLNEGGIETFYVAGTWARESAESRFFILRPPPSPLFDSEGNTLPEANRETKWKAFQKNINIGGPFRGLSPHDIDGWMVAIPKAQIDAVASAEAVEPEAAKTKQALTEFLPSWLLEGILDQSKGQGFPMLEAIHNSPPSDLSIVFRAPPQMLKALREKIANTHPEDRGPIPLALKLVRIYELCGFRFSITLGEDVDLDLVAQFEVEKASEVIKNVEGLRRDLIEAARKKNRWDRNSKTRRARQLNYQITHGIIKAIKYIVKDGSLRLDRPVETIRQIAADALDLKEDPEDFVKPTEIDEGIVNINRGDENRPDDEEADGGNEGRGEDDQNLDDDTDAGEGMEFDYDPDEDDLFKLFKPDPSD